VTGVSRASVREAIEQAQTIAAAGLFTSLLASLLAYLARKKRRGTFPQ